MTPPNSEEIQRLQGGFNRVRSRVQELKEVEATTQPELVLKGAGRLQVDCQSIQTRTGCIKTKPLFGQPDAEPEEVWRIYIGAAELETETTKLLENAERRKGSGRPLKE